MVVPQLLDGERVYHDRTAYTAGGKLDDLRRDSLRCPIRLSAEAQGLTDIRVSLRHTVNELGVKPSMLEKRNHVHSLTDRGVALILN
jgi:hypothetical protein